MAKAVGRDQLVPMERLIRILICLADAQRYGVPVTTLLRVADLHEDTDATRAQLRRDLQLLRQGGWDIENVAAEGADARYRLRVRRNRLAVLLTPGERAALQELVTHISVDHAAPPPFLGALAHAVADRCLVTFTHRGRSQTVHPDELYTVQAGWVLVARDVDTLTRAEFVSAWMSEIYLHDPGTALPRAEPIGERPDPIRWALDPPRTVTLVAAREFVPDVLRLLPGAVVQDGVAAYESEPGLDDSEVVITVEVTNRAAFKTRLFVLGLRARVVGPPDYLAEIVDNLKAVVEVGDGALR